jgi:ABC-2 type transport system ATP-binding protein
MEKTTVLTAKDISKRFFYSAYNERNLKNKFVNLHKKKDKSKIAFNALDNVNFSVSKGEFLGIVGKNGSGKSTLLKIISAIYVPTTGEIVKTGKIIPFIELGVGFNPELTGRNNIYLNGALFGYSNKEMDEKIDMILDFAELKDFIDQKLKNYSSGMQVRLAFSVAKTVAADILLIDEILAVGDRNFRNKCYDYFTNIHKKGKTVIFVSHDMKAITKFCTRVIVLDKAKIIFDGKPHIAAKKYNNLFNK